MPYLRTRDGQRLHYLDVGRGKPVVLLHGFGMPAALWLPLVAPLALRHRFILPDLRGFGGSHRVPLSQACLLTQHADDLADLLRSLDLRDVPLGGLSMGACTALQYHRLYGFERVSRYLHMDQSPCVRNTADWSHGLLGTRQAERLEIWAALMGELRPYRGAAFDRVPRSLRRRLWRSLAEFFAYAFHGRAWRGIAQLAQFELLIRRVAPTANWTIYLDCIESYLEGDYDWRPSLPQIEVPVTVLVGMQSVMYPAAGQLEIGRLLPSARVVRIENCGHAIPFEAPRRFFLELARFAG
ncbi:MAG TPA: alpha/beta hydrolase [Solimonas sp.]|nr:alpha/beta hydrolase [Solimonas sp.]